MQEAGGHIVARCYRLDGFSRSHICSSCVGDAYELLHRLGLESLPELDCGLDWAKLNIELQAAGLNVVKSSLGV